MYQRAASLLRTGVGRMGAMTDADRAESSDVPAVAAVTGDSSAAGAEPTRWERAADCFDRWRGGQPHAMDELVRLMSPVLWHVVRAYGLDRALAEDVVQTTWLTLVRRHESIQEPKAVSGWLTTCARREAWRVGKLQRRADPTEAEHLEPRLPTADSAEDTAVLDDQSRRLWDAVGTLDDRCRRLLRVVAFEERPDYARLAQELSMPIGSIGPTRQRCLAKVRTLLEGAKPKTSGGME